MQSITLRNNQLDDDDIKLIASGIGDTYRQNTKLLHLNLCSNWFGDKGATALAKVFYKNKNFIYEYLFKNYLRHFAQIVHF